jgi:hypothetical protein
MVCFFVAVQLCFLACQGLGAAHAVGKTGVSINWRFGKTRSSGKLHCHRKQGEGSPGAWR